MHMIAKLCLASPIMAYRLLFFLGKRTRSIKSANDIRNAAWIDRPAEIIALRKVTPEVD